MCERKIGAIIQGHYVIWGRTVDVEEERSLVQTHDLVKGKDTHK
jgi:hypothetical protein